MLGTGWESERKTLLDEISALLDNLDAPSLSGCRASPLLSMFDV